LIDLFAWLISHQPAVLFSRNKPATSQPAALFSRNKPALSNATGKMGGCAASLRLVSLVFVG
jgi:hypothetical protein